MLRQFVMWGSAAGAVFFVFAAKHSRDNEIAFISLGLAFLCFGMWLYAVSTRSAPRDPDRASVFRIVSLWLKAKERDLQSRVDQKP